MFHSEQEVIFNTDNTDHHEQIRSLQNQLEEMRMWNSALQTRLQQQPTNQRGGGVGGAKDSPLKGGDSRGGTDQATSADTSFMHDTFGKSCHFYYQ